MRVLYHRVLNVFTTIDVCSGLLSYNFNRKKNR